MSKYKEIVDALQKQIDENTRRAVEITKNRNWSMGGDTTLTLLGDLEAPFLRALSRKCDKLGIYVATELTENKPLVIDRETWDSAVANSDDIDNNAYMSAVAEGVGLLIDRADLKRKDICIVGRGKAVKGLPEYLLNLDHTVTVCHSKTGHKALAEHLYSAEIVVLGTPELPEGVTFPAAELVIDIGGAVDSAFAEACDNYLGPRDIGRLCTSILCNRAARWYL